MTSKSRTTDTALGVGFAVLIAVGLYVFIRRADPAQVRAALSRLDARLVLELLALNCASVFLGGWRLAVLVDAVFPGISAASMARINLLSLASGYTAVGKLTAPMKAALLKRLHGVPLSSSTPAIIAEQAFDLVALGATAVLASLLSRPLLDQIVRYLRVDVGRIGAVLVAATLAAGAAVAVALLLRNRVAFLRRATSAAAAVGRDRRCVWKSVALTTALHGLNLAAVAVTLHGLGLCLGFGLVLWLTCIPILAGMVSPIPGGLGVRELLFAGIYAISCGASAAAVLAPLVMRAAFFAALPVCYGLLRLTGLHR